MEVAKIKVKNTSGLHLRTAAKIVDFARRCKSKITLCHDCKFADSCSVLQLLSLGAARDTEIAVIAQGQDEKEVIGKIGELFSEGAGI
jgi:phosphocarrier protein HPr